METLIIVAAALLMVTGFFGSFLPVLPGPPLSYGGLLLLQFLTAPFSPTFLIFWAVVVVQLMILDNVIPAYGTKKFGGTRYGIWGSMIGMVAGMFFFPPVGLIVGPLAGAFVGELIGGKSSDRAIKSALGSFAGFLAGALLKTIAAGVMGYYFFISVF